MTMWHSGSSVLYFQFKVVTNFLFTDLLAVCTEIAPIKLIAGERNIPVQVTYLLVGRKEFLNSFTLLSLPGRNQNAINGVTLLLENTQHLDFVYLSWYKPQASAKQNKKHLCESHYAYTLNYRKRTMMGLYTIKNEFNIWQSFICIDFKLFYSQVNVHKTGG